MTRTCVNCGDHIHPLRIKILPNTMQCVQCSTTEKVYGHTLITGKHTYSEIQIVSKETSAHLSSLGKRKGQCVSSGVMFKFDPKHK